MAASKRNWSPLLAASPSPYMERTRQKMRQAALDESRSSMKNEALLRDVELLEQGVRTSAEETRKLDVLKRHYMEYVSSVYPHWVEQAALHREKKRIMGSNASLRAEAATRAPRPATHQMRECGSRNESRHIDTQVPPTSPTHLPGTTRPRDPMMDTAELPPLVPSRSTGQHVLLGSHSEVGGVEQEAPPPGHAHLQPPPGTEQSSYTTSMHNTDKAITASSLISHVQPPVSVGRNGTNAQDFETKAGASAQPPAAHHSSSTFLTQDLSESTSSTSSLSMGELNPISSPPSFKKAGVSESSGSNHPQQAAQPIPSSGKGTEESSCSPTPSNASTPSCEGNTALQGDPQVRGIAPTVVGLTQGQPVTAVEEVEQKSEDKSLLSDEDSPTVSKQERESCQLEVASLSGNSLADEPCEEGSVLPSVTSPPHQHGDDRPQPNLTILDIVSPQESDIQDQEPSLLPENLKLELEPANMSIGATPPEEVLTDQQPNMNGTSLEQQAPLLPKEEELVEEDNEDDDSFWDVEPGATAVSPSLPLFDSGTPATGEPEQSKLPSQDKPPEDGTGVKSDLHAPGRNLLSGLLNQGANGQSGFQTESSSTVSENGFADNGRHEEENRLPLTASAEYKQLISSFSRSAGVAGGEGGEEGESAQSSLLSDTSAVKQIEEEVMGSKNETSNGNRAVSAESTGPGQVDAPTLANGKEQSPTALPTATAAAYNPSLVVGSDSRGGKEEGERQRSLSASLKKKKGFWGDSDSDDDIELSAVTPGGEEDDNEFDFYN